MSAYYNEWDPFAAQWLRNLIAAGLLPSGEVDERSIADVHPADVRGFDQVHFFAGIGVWPFSLRSAGVPDDDNVWSGSCPCQPFSVAGDGKGFDDDRHLWPEFFRLIRECRPAVVFGEQVAGKAGLEWFDHVLLDLEAARYAVGAADLPACGVGAPHLRQRLFFVAHACRQGLQVRGPSDLRGAWGWNQGGVPEQPGHAVRGLADPGEAGRGCLGRGEVDHQREEGTHPDVAHERPRPGPVNGFWADADWISCRDGKWRPVEPGASPLAPRSPGDVGRLRAYGNAITAPLAIEFIRAALPFQP